MQANGKEMNIEMEIRRTQWAHRPPDSVAQCKQMQTKCSALKVNERKMNAQSKRECIRKIKAQYYTGLYFVAE